MTFSGSKENVARFVADIILHSGPDYPWITITTRGSSGDCSVTIATEELLDVIVLGRANFFSLTHTNISQLPTQAG